jgi:hypothetical protein
MLDTSRRRGPAGTSRDADDVRDIDLFRLHYSSDSGEFQAEMAQTPQPTVSLVGCGTNAHVDGLLEKGRIDAVGLPDGDDTRMPLAAPQLSCHAMSTRLPTTGRTAGQCHAGASTEYHMQGIRQAMITPTS